MERANTITYLKGETIQTGKKNPNKKQKRKSPKKKKKKKTNPIKGRTRTVFYRLWQFSERF